MDQETIMLIDDLDRLVHLIVRVKADVGTPEFRDHWGEISELADSISQRIKEPE